MNDLELSYQEYYKLSRYDRNGNLCTVKAHYELLKSDYLKHFFFKILTLFPPSIEYIQPVVSVKNAFLRIFFKNYKSELRRAFSLGINDYKIEINLAPINLQNREIHWEYVHKYLQNSIIPKKNKDHSHIQNTVIKIGLRTSAIVIAVVDNRYESEIIEFLLDYLKFFNKKPNEQFSIVKNSILLIPPD